MGFILKNIKVIQNGDVYREVDTVADYQFEIKFPYGLVSNLSASQLTLMIGLSYSEKLNLTQIIWRNITLYDSKCLSYEDDVFVVKPNMCINPKTNECSYIPVSYF